MSIHAANPVKSSRLQAVFDVLTRAGADGATSLEIQERARVVAAGTCVSELRHGGIGVVCRYEGRTDSGRKAYRYWLQRYAPAETRVAA